MAINLGRWIKDRKREVGDVASRAYDQANIYDSGRSWNTRTPSVQKAKQSQVAQFRDIFDANTKSDQQTRVRAGQPRYYRDQQIAMGNKRPYENLGSQIVGNSARFLNSGAYAQHAGSETARGALAQATNNIEALNASLRRQNEIRQKYGGATSGLLGAGTIYDNPDEMMNLGNAEIAERVGLTTLGTASEVIPLKGVAKGASLGKRVAANAALDSTTGAGESIARQYAQTGRIDPKVVAGDVAASTVLGGVPALAGGGAKKGAKQVARKTNPAYDELLTTRQTAQRAYDVESNPKVRKEIGTYLSELDAEIRKEAGIIPKARAAGPDDFKEIKVPESLKAPVESKTIYRGGKAYDKKLVGSDGASFSTDKSIADRWRGGTKDGVTEAFQLKSDANVLVAPKPDVPLGQVTDSDKFNLVAKANREGYDAVDMTAFGENEIRVINPEAISQAPVESKGAEPLSDLMPDLKSRQKVDKVTAQAEEIAAKTGGNVEDIARNIKRYGYDSTANMYSSKSDAMPFNPDTKQGIKNIDAVATAELKKQKPQVTAKQTDSKPRVTAKEAPKVDELKQYGIDLEQKIKTVEKEFNSIYDSIRKEGYNLEDLGRKQVLAERGEYKPTDKEVAMFDKITNRLNEAFDNSGMDMEGFRNYYRPQTKEGSVKLPTTREELLNFGYDKKRTNAYNPDEIDYGIQPLVDYVVKAEHRPTLLKASIVDAAEVDGRVVSKDGVEKAAELSESLQKKIHEKSKSKGVLNNDTTTELLEIGKNEGYKQEAVTYNPGKIIQEPKAMMEKAGIWDRGFKQYDNSTGYASEFARQLGENKIGQDQVGEALEKALRERMPGLEDSTINGLRSFVEKRIREYGLSPEEAIGTYNTAFKSAAKAELFRTGKTLKFTSNKMRKMVNEQINDRLLSSSYSKNAAQNLDSFISERVNVSLRGANIVSAMFETGDYANIGAKYGYKDIFKSKLGVTGVKGDTLAYSHKYGQGGAHYLSDDIPQVTKLKDIWNDPKMSTTRKLYESYRTGENKLLVFRYVEQHKTEMFFRAADNFYRKRGLQGGQLVDAVMEDYYKTMLPHKLATANRVLGKLPNSVTQYMNWSLQATKRFGRTISGSDTGGKFGDLSQVERIGRGVSREILPKVVAASVLGVPIMQVMGMRDFTGATEGDFSGIPEEEKTQIDAVVDFLSVSPVIGMASNYYFADRRNDIAAKRKAEGEVYKAEGAKEDTFAEVTKQNLSNLIPMKTQIKKSKDVWDAAQRGYYENRDGRVQLEGPTGLSKYGNMVTGKTYTPDFREYQDAPSALSVLQGKASPLDLITKNKSVSNLVQSITGESTNEYQRPLTDKYSDAYKAAEGEERKALMDGGKKYNQTLDDLKRNNREAYNSYIKSMDGNHVSPERWREITGGSASNDIDLTIFNTMGERKKQLKADMDRAGRNDNGEFNYDPLYDLPSPKARQVLQLKSTATGDDLALRNILYKEEWYKDFVAKQSDYYENMPEYDGVSKEPTARVKEWNGYNDSYNELSGVTGDTLKKDYPLVHELKEITRKYGFKTEESDAILDNWGSATWEAYNKQKDAVDQKKLDLINKMRVIEGQEPLSLNAYQQATEIADTTGADDGFTPWGKGRRGGGRGGSKTKNTGSVNKYNISTKGTFNVSPKISVKAPSRASVKSKATAKPKVSIKKSRV